MPEAGDDHAIELRACGLSNMKQLSMPSQLAPQNLAVRACFTGAGEEKLRGWLPE